jgi:oxygen-independent coproporphyrinogen-3 oxidase
MTGLAVYVHVPYCRTICPYCDFNRTSIGGGVPAAYIDALCRQIEASKGPDQAATVFFGGGTPSLLGRDNLSRVFSALKNRFSLAADAEISLEANPDDVTPALIDDWKSLGVNRISLGVQSFDQRVLEYLGRRHDAACARGACEIVAGLFENWSLDLIFGPPPGEAWEETLKAAAQYDPPHLSAYGLTYEPGTPFEARAHEAVDDDAALAMYWQVDPLLPSLARYEVSNFAKPGFECRHNLVYWSNEEYAGFGPGAYSFVNGLRARTAVDIAGYVDDPVNVDECTALTWDEVRVETLIQRFRLRDGLERTYYQRRFGTSVDSDFGPALGRLVDRGLLKDDGERIAPTPKGFEMNNEIGLELVDALGERVEGPASAVAPLPAEVRGAAAKVSGRPVTAEDSQKQT